MGYSPMPRLRPRMVTTTNFEEWAADPRSLTFEEYMAELVPDDGLPSPSRASATGQALARCVP